MAYKISIQCLAFGEAVSGPELEPVRLELATERISVRELLVRTVTAQIRAMSEQRLADADSRQTLARHYLTASEVEQQAASGRVRMPAENRQYQQPAIDIKEEIAKVLHGFEAKAFRVVVDGAIQQSSLSAPDAIGRRLTCGE